MARPRERAPGPRAKTTHPLRLFGGSANRPLAEEVARALGVGLGRAVTTRLPDSETHVLLEDPVRGDDVFFLQSCSAPVNDHLVETLLYLDAFRRASAHSINVVLPYFPYARQERMARGREAISARVVATMLESMGATRVVYVDIHSPAIQGFFTIPVDPLSAVEVLAAQYQRKRRFRDAVVVAPDEGRVKLAGRYAELLRLPLVLMHKRRIGFDRSETSHVVGEIRGKIPILIDDIIAGGSVLDQVGSLVKAGARPEVHLAVTHGVLTASARARLDRPEIRELWITDTVAMTPERRHPKVRVCSVAPLLAEAIARIHRGESTGDLTRRT